MKPNLRVVFDTNVFISAIIFGGNPRVCLELAREGKIQLVTSSAILLESAKKLNEKFGWSQEEIEEVIEGIGVFAEIVSPKEHLQIVKKDEADNRILECAAEGKTDFIVSGDKRHLLPLKKFKKIPIVSPAKFVRLYRKMIK